MRELLRDGTYLRYWLSVVVSFLGDAMTRVTLIYVTAKLTDSPVVIALLVLAQLLPSGLLGAFIGPLVDRVPKWGLLVGSDLARIVLVLAMIPVLDSVAALVVLALLHGVGKAVFETARIAAVPVIVGSPTRIPAAVALFQSTNQAVNLVGPAVGGILVSLGSAAVVLVVDAVTFAISGALLFSMAVLRQVPVGGGAGEPYWQALRTGVRGVLAVPSLRALFALTVPFAVVFGLFTTNLNAQLLTVFDLPAFEFGVAQAVLAGGSMLGALLGPALVRRYTSSNGLLLSSLGLFGVALITLAPTGWLVGAVGWWAVLQWCLTTGLFSSLVQVPVANTLLRDLPEEMRGRGVGLLNTVTINFTLLGVLLGGGAAELVGVATSLVAAGVVLVLVAAAAFGVPSLRPARAGAAPDTSAGVAPETGAKVAPETPAEVANES
jgi:hypothetical protein